MMKTSAYRGENNTFSTTVQTFCSASVTPLSPYHTAPSNLKVHLFADYICTINCHDITFNADIQTIQ